MRGGGGHLDHAHRRAGELKGEEVRAAVDCRSETVNQKIRQAQLDKTRYMLIVGDKEVAAGTVSVRLRSGEQLAPQSFDRFKGIITQAIADKVKDPKVEPREPAD